MSSIIKSLSIIGLWNKFNLNIDFDNKVNILIGKNGSGKSTILKIIEFMIKKGIEHREIQFDSISLEMSEGKKIEVKRNTLDIDNPIGKIELDEEKVIELLQKLQNDILDNMRNKKVSEKNSSKRNQIKYEGTVEEKINFCYLSTFDMEVSNRTYFKDDNNIEIKTELDSLLHSLITKFKLYQLKLKDSVEKIQKEFDEDFKKLAESNSNSSLQEIKNKLLKKEEKIKEIYFQKDFFRKKLDELFSSNDKKIALDENNSIIFEIRENEHLTPFQLSSGEKQMLIIMLTVILLENKRTIVVMDEPEISLHVEWQKVFINTLLELNNNIQLIIATHSPSIVTKGYRNNIIKINNFKVEKE